MSSDTSINDALRNAISFYINAMHTAFPSQIISYDYRVQKASIQPLLSKRFTDGIIQDLPVITNVPVVFPQSGGASLNFPVNEEDLVLTICSERSLDRWLEEGTKNAPFNTRKYDLTDAIVIPGLYPFNHPSPAKNNTDVLLTYQGSSIVLNPSGKLALGTRLVEVLDIISQTLSSISTITVNTAVPNVAQPINNATSFTALKTLIDSIKGVIS